MNGFCVSIKEGAFNKLLDTAFKSKTVQDALHNTTAVSIMGATVSVEWQVTKAPVVSFADIPDGTEVWNEKGESIKPSDEAFLLEAQTSLKVDGGDASVIPIDVVAAPQVNGKDVLFTVNGIVNRPDYSELDKGVMKALSGVIIGSVNKVLGNSGGQTTSLFSLDNLVELGITVNKPAFIKKDGAIYLLTNADGDRSIIDTTKSSNKDVAFAFGTDELNAVLNKQFDECKDEYAFSRHFDDTKKVSVLGHFGVRLDVSASVKKIGCSSIDDDSIKIAISPQLSFAGHLVLFGTNASGVGYDYEFKPDPLHAKAKFEVKESYVSVSLSDLEDFNVILHPIGNWIEKAESCWAWPLEEAVQNTIIAVAHNDFTKGFGVGFRERDIVVKDMYALVLKVTNMSNQYVNKTMVFSGDLDITLK